MTIRPISTVVGCLIALTWILASHAPAQESGFQERFVGTWNADKEKTKKYADEHEDAVAPPQEMLDDMPKITMTIAESGKASLSMESGPGEAMKLEGSWKLDKEIDDDHAEVTITMNVGDQDDPKACKVELLDDETLVLAIAHEPVLVLVRAKGESGKQEDKKDAADK
jgi:hypothetical protein